MINFFLNKEEQSNFKEGEVFKDVKTGNKYLIKTSLINSSDVLYVHLTNLDDSEIETPVWISKNKRILVDFGNEISWKKTPEIIKNCQKMNHKIDETKVYSQTYYTCEKCGYKYSCC